MLLVILNFLGPSTKCSHNICANRGVCVQQWNSYTCDCDMTSYTGPTCSDGKYFKQEQFSCSVSQLLHDLA
jgi:leucine-rich repeat transmembrane neuronal protein 1/2